MSTKYCLIRQLNLDRIARELRARVSHIWAKHIFDKNTNRHDEFVGYDILLLDKGERGCAKKCNETKKEGQESSDEANIYRLNQELFLEVATSESGLEISRRKIREKGEKRPRKKKEVQYVQYEDVILPNIQTEVIVPYVQYGLLSPHKFEAGLTPIKRNSLIPPQLDGSKIVFHRAERQI